MGHLDFLELESVVHVHHDSTVEVSCEESEDIHNTILPCNCIGHEDGLDLLHGH